jgi:valyl-tRNA synthetase
MALDAGFSDLNFGQPGDVCEGGVHAGGILGTVDAGAKTKPMEPGHMGRLRRSHKKEPILGAAIMVELQKWGVPLEKEIAAELAANPIPFIGEDKADAKVWSIDTPPPYPSGKWHVGAVAGYSLIDMIARSKRMEGYDVLFPWGVDRNGINIEFTVEKKTEPMRFWAAKMGAVEGRDAFNKACTEEISQYTDEMVRIGERIGLSCDFKGGYKTDSPEYRAFSQAMFLELFQKGLIVEELRPNTYDPKLGTTIADAEVYYEERKTRLNHVNWTCKETGETLVISTTRPELICACRAVLVHPDNEATAHLIGKTAVLPIERGDGLGREVPILAHTHVKMDFGSGVMMVCSFGDQADVQLFRELELQPIAAIDMEGKMTEVAGKYAGLKVEPARQQIIKDLEAEGLLPDFDKINQKFPISERSKAAVEIIALKEWYVKQTHCIDDLREIANGLEFVPAKHRTLLLDWIDTVSIDWPISRRRWYHTEIPLWLMEDADGNEAPYVIVPPADAADPDYYQPWKAGFPAGSRAVHRYERTDLGTPEEFLAAHPELTVVGETKVFDTWMDSSVSNQYILKDHTAKAWHADHVCSIRPQGRDIVRTWLYYTLLKTHLLKGKAGFKNAWIHGMGMDKNGRKMSKSTGNVIDPADILEKTGSDAFRLWIAGECSIGDDFRINEQKIQGAGKFLQKFANVVKFVSTFDNPERPAELEPVDAWILGELDAVTTDATEGYANIDFFNPANQVRSFVWNLFAPHYMEMVKARAYAGNASSCWTLHEVTKRCLHLLAPVTPFITHYLASRVYEIDVHRAQFPPALGFDANAEQTEAIIEFNGLVWKSKQEQSLSLNSPISGIAIPSELADIADVLTKMHSLED